VRRLGFVAYGAGVVGITLFAAPPAINLLIFLLDQPRTAKWTTWLIYWLIATLAPIILSIIAWVVVQKYRAQWLPHLIFIPTTIVLCRESSGVFLRKSGLLYHDMMEMDAMMLSVYYMLLALLVHVTALAVAGVSSIRRWANGS
jgi:hypothetical protein